MPVGVPSALGHLRSFRLAVSAQARPLEPDQFVVGLEDPSPTPAAHRLVLHAPAGEEARFGGVFKAVGSVRFDLPNLSIRGRRSSSPLPLT